MDLSLHMDVVFKNISNTVHKQCPFINIIDHLAKMIVIYQSK